MTDRKLHQAPQGYCPELRAGLNRRGAGLRMAAFAAAALTPWQAFAQSYPNKPVRMLVGNPAGGLGDVVARAVAQGLGDSTRQPFVVENKAGASGILATDTVAKASPDGYNLLLATDGMIVVNQFVFPKLPYDPNKDLQSVALIGRATLVLVVNPTTGIKTADEFLRQTRVRSNRLNYSSGGPGHPLHLAMELVKSRMGLTIAHIPYKGSAPAVQALLAGEVSAMIVGVAEAMQHIKAGKLVPLAATGPGAAEIFPSLPQLKSLNPDLDIAPWFGLFAPAGTGAGTVTMLNENVNRLLRTPDMQKRFAEYGVSPMPSDVAQLDTLIAAERAKYGPLVKALALTAE